jgi:acylphosphatase
MSRSYKGIYINVSGVVQGVGFRYFVKRVADMYGVTGLVRNLYDGSVEVQAEGDEGILQGFLKEIRIGPGHAHVANTRVDWLEYKGKFKEFRIEL